MSRYIDAEDAVKRLYQTVAVPLINVYSAKRNGLMHSPQPMWLRLGTESGYKTDSVIGIVQSAVIIQLKVWAMCRQDMSFWLLPPLRRKDGYFRSPLI